MNDLEPISAAEANAQVGISAFAGGSGEDRYPMINHTTLSDSLILGSEGIREVARKLSNWVDNARSATGRSSMFDRGAYTPPDNIFDQMMSAKYAINNDDIVSGVADTTESFAFQGLKWEGPDADEADIFNQMSRDLNLDEVIRQMWRDLYTYSQFVVAEVWGTKTFKVKGKTEEGNPRRKKYTIQCPIKLALLDPTKVIPVGHSPLGTDLLAWSANNAEVDYFIRMRNGDFVDPVMDQFILGRFEPSAQEKHELESLGVDTRNLLLLNPERVWRHTMTKNTGERFAQVRLRSLFKLLDLKQQLIAADRAMLIGAANYILLVRKGSPEQPAKGQELKNLRENFNFIARLPVIISDHRLEVDIITPKTDFVLQGERYDMIDTRILMRLMGTLSLGARGQRNETNVTLSRSVGRNMESRRHMIKRSLEAKVARKVYNHPANADEFDEGEEPNLVFVPRNIALDIDAAFIQAIMSLRQSKEISRETTLEHFGFDQETEAQRREFEEKMFDDIFQTIVPFSSPEGGGAPQGGTPAQTGRDGGRPTGGGEPSKNPSKPRDRTADNNTPKGQG